MDRCAPFGPITAVFFDLDDTLLQTTNSDTSAMEEVAAKLAETYPNVSWDDILGTWTAAFKDAPWDASHQCACATDLRWGPQTFHPEGQVPVEEWRAGLWRRALADHGIDDDVLGTTLQRCFTSSRTRRFRFTTEVQELVREVKARGYKVALITNGHADIQRGKIEATQATAVLGGNILVGGEEIAAGRHEKPHVSIFHSACRLVNCLPNEAIHVGDSLASDIQGGINAGLAATVWVSPRGAAAPQDGPQPTFTISHVGALLPILEQLSEAHVPSSACAATPEA